SSHFDDDSIIKFDSISKAIESYYQSKSFQNKLTSRKAELLNAVSSKLEKCIKKINIQTKNLSDSEKKEDFKICGELITSNLYRISEGMEQITVTNYYVPDCPELTILLNPSISPSSNAQAYFKKYSKAKKTYQAAESLLEGLEKEKIYFESLLFQIEDANTENDIEDIKNELVNEKIITENTKSKKTVLPLTPLEFISSDGFVILVGKNNRQNDHLTFKTAARTDFWLHTRNIPGSHVIIKADKKDVPESTLIEACILAAYHSKSRNSTHVPVDYTLVKYVKKPGGAKPGFVIYDNFKTKTVDPDSSIIEKIKK
ncbi:MAG: NFACT family protein, partial [Ignavibacteriales bacterium]